MNLMEQFFIKRGHGVLWQFKGIKMKKVAMYLLLSTVFSAHADNVLISSIGTFNSDKPYAKGTVAIGNQQFIKSEKNSVIIGDQACGQFGCLATNGVAIGYNTTTRDNSVAIGAEANAFGTNSGQIMEGRNENSNTLQIGSGYIVDKDGFFNSTVKNAQTLVVNGDVFSSGIIQSHGGDMMGGKIVNLAAGVDDTDAVNVGQLKDGLADVYNQSVSYTDGQFDVLNQTIVEGDENTLNQANTYTDSKVSTITNVSNNYTDARVSGAVSNLMNQINEGDIRTLNQANNYTDAKFNEVNDSVKRVGALAMLQFAQDHNPCHRSSLALSIGGYRGKHAIGAQYAYKVTHRMRLQGTAAYDGKHVGYSVSGNYSWE